jgi:hypothetical protein
MFAVAGRWMLDTSMSDQRNEGLRGIVAGVRQLPGFVHGFWSADTSDPSVNLTYIVFETKEQAEDFGRAVADDTAAQTASGVTLDELRIVEILAHG